MDHNGTVAHLTRRGWQR